GYPDGNQFVQDSGINHGYSLQNDLQCGFLVKGYRPELLGHPRNTEAGLHQLPSVRRKPSRSGHIPASLFNWSSCSTSVMPLTCCATSGGTRPKRFSSRPKIALCVTAASFSAINSF